MPRRKPLRSGDTFRLRSGDGRYGYGQIVLPGDVMYITVAEGLYPEAVELSEVDLSAVLLCGWTMDARIHHGMWEVIGNVPVRAAVPRPCYKVGFRGSIWLESFDQKPIRPALDREAEALDYRTSAAPMAFEKALLAHHGLGEWQPHFDRLKYEHVLAQERLSRTFLS